MGDKVLVFDSADTYESEFGPTGTSNGTGNGQFQYPRGMLYDLAQRRKALQNMATVTISIPSR